MTGKILGFEIAANSGMISREGGKRYNFSKENWKERNALQKDAKIVFHTKTNKE